MNWIYVGIIAGNIMTSGHADKEACLGRKDIMEEQKVHGVCIEAPRAYGSFTNGTILTGPSMCVGLDGQVKPCQ